MTLPTQFPHRILMAVPAARVAAVVAWLQANVDPTCRADLGPGLNASGLASDPVTHRWQCGSWTDPQCMSILVKLCQLAGVATPSLATWNGWTGQEKRAWLQSVRAGVLAGFGIYVTLADNAGTWDDPEALLSLAGLKRVIA